MYAAAAAGQVDHELYLLGKPVDKAVDPMAQENEEVSRSVLWEGGRAIWQGQDLRMNSFLDHM